MTRLERWADAVLARSPGPWMTALAGRHRLAVLAYHDISNAQRFEAQIRYLARNYHPISLADLERAIEQRKSLPAGAVLVTFDDGDRSVLETGAPILHREKVPAVAFVIAEILEGTRAPWFAEARSLVATGGSIGEAPGAPPHAVVRALKAMPNSQRLDALRRLRDSAPSAVPPRPQLRGEELRELEACGITVGNHTMSHPCLPRCTSEEVERELHDSDMALSRVLGHPVRSFAYPNGDFDRRAAGVLRRLGYKTGFICKHSRSRMPPENVLAIHRMYVNSHDTLDRFRIIASGLHPLLHNLRQRLLRRSRWHARCHAG